MSWWQQWGEAGWTSFGFFWKAGWAFVLGYAISAMIQAFVPKARLTRHVGGKGPRSVVLATVFGAASSSCSFAALAAARSLVLKGASFVAAIAFMFASTNLVIELGVLIFIFLGWEYLAAEIVGGFVLIAISSVLVRLLLPRSWRERAREAVEEQAEPEEDDFDWKERITSAHGWQLVGQRFVADWKMVWEEIAIGFTIAGLVAALVPARFWETIFLATGDAGAEAGFLVTLENAAVAPFVAAATFIGSMGNIPLATVLAANGVAFAGVMGFIYSDLMVPPLVVINARYYGWRIALFIAGVMYVSIVATALLLHGAFAVTGLTPESQREVAEVTRVELDYTAWLNLAFVVVAAALVALHRRGSADGDGGGHDHGGGLGPKRIVTLTALGSVAVGVVLHLVGG